MNSDEKAWYAVRTRSRQEKAVSSHLQAKGLKEFLPVYQMRRQWSDRMKTVDYPLFDGYLFCYFDSQMLMPVLSSPGVAYIVGFGNKPAPIPEN